MHYNVLHISRKISPLRIKITSLIQKGLYLQALELYSQTPYLPIQASKFLFPSIIKACTCLTNLSYGTTLQSKIVKTGLESDPYIVSSLVQMYLNCGSLDSAVKVFDNMQQSENLAQDVAIWNCLIDGLCKNYSFEKGLGIFRRMQAMNVKPDGYSLCILIRLCGFYLGLFHGREVHGYIVKNMLDDDQFIVTSMVDMYSNKGRLRDAWNVFENLKDKSNIAVWNAMIGGFWENGFSEKGTDLYSLAKSEGLKFESRTFSIVFSCCSQGCDLDFGLQVHCDVVKTGYKFDTYTCTSLLTFYSRFGHVGDAERIFNATIGNKKAAIWNSMISAYVSHGCNDKALNLYHQMRKSNVRSDSFTVSNTLIASGIIGSCFSCTMLHAEIEKRPIKDCISVQTSLLTMYSKLGRVDDARKIFEYMKEKDLVAYGSMISGNCENKRFNEASVLFKKFVSYDLKPDHSILSGAIIACVGHKDSKLGLCIHGLAIKGGFNVDPVTATSLIEFYSKLEQPEMAENSFSDASSASHKNLVMWNSLILCYSQNSLHEAALSLVPELTKKGLCPDSITITTILATVSKTTSLLRGKAIHGYYIRSIFERSEETQVENSLVDMYTKSGCLKYAERVFKKMPNRDIVAWNCMIEGYGSHGRCTKALDLYKDMQSSGTASPDEITFMSLISSCNHSGLISEGLNLFRSMREEHGIEPKLQHYVIVVDLLGRARRLHDAYALIENMKIEPNRGIWLSLLAACRVHRDLELGELAANKLIEMDPSRGSNYAQLLNLYIEAGLEEKAANLRVVMKRKGLEKVPGCSWIELRDKVNVFFSGDSTSHETVKIHETLHGLKNNMRRKERFYEEINI